MKKGKLYIETDQNNQPSVIFHPVNNTVWMNKNELCELFGIYIQELNLRLNEILDSKNIHIEDVCKYHRFVKSNRIRYDITEVNVEVIIALSFHIDTVNAEILRKWIIEQIMKPKGVYFPLADISHESFWN